MSTVAERVAAGLAFLDEREPAATGKIDLALLDLGDCDDCVLGQVYGCYLSGSDMLGLTEREAAELGFTVRYEIGQEWRSEAEDAEFAELTAEWRRVITERRAAS